MDTGVIEGFYGHCWSWQQRQNMIRFLADNDFQSYCYAPKSDPYLRATWHLGWPKAEFKELQTLSELAKEKHIDFGVGLSSLGLQDLWQDNGQQVLKNRLQQIAELKPEFIGLLFDDMRGDDEKLAQFQTDVCHFVQSLLPDTKLIFCPSYYSLDPILEEIFGNMPTNYWQDIGQQLDQSIGVFWTGDKVITESYSSESLILVNDLFERNVTLWDNSVANDGKKTSPFIPFKALSESVDIADKVASRFVNPMNQMSVAQAVLLTLKQHGNDQQRLHDAISQYTPKLSDQILSNISLFMCQGLDNLSVERKELIDVYKNSSESIAKDIVDWLEGKYTFDPACLT